jgi:hypothetical protein
VLKDSLCCQWAYSQLERDGYVNVGGKVLLSVCPDIHGTLRHQEGTLRHKGNAAEIIKKTLQRC